MRTWESEPTHKIFNGLFELWEGMRSGGEQNKIDYSILFSSILSPSPSIQTGL